MGTSVREPQNWRGDEQQNTWPEPQPHREGSLSALFIHSGPPPSPSSSKKPLPSPRLQSLCSSGRPAQLEHQAHQVLLPLFERDTQSLKWHTIHKTVYTRYQSWLFFTDTNCLLVSVLLGWTIKPTSAQSSRLSSTGSLPGRLFSKWPHASTFKSTSPFGLFPVASRFLHLSSQLGMYSKN